MGSSSAAPAPHEEGKPPHGYAPGGLPPQQQQWAVPPPQGGQPAPYGYPPQGGAPPPYGQPPLQYGPATGYPVTAPPIRAQPIPGRWVQPPAVAPLPGQVLLYYEQVAPETGCCKCDGLSSAGLFTIILMFVFGVPCLAFIPCCMPECFEPMQRPVYGYPNGAMPVGTPPPGYS